ncbi:bifunctional homocysteine S-methyltransferase/methylenetetrahydrofolate reductase [Saccharibacillus sp. CPCC 101409]|uniref:bifunctional homocysteine S-methyltransferase/methylenetetrahydrofolate reductase n=1 Tax=Saccharibacillus sp. CPCC 101409 TaxID=3058041 RepID=UPI0026710C55|nr:bifunctional homocysteine S-methyltransferase/methylenetetrahydrofolate reductase [Saccharibacillus sp. CPCC 101409]MDO3411878.1 bifunctional homocysteine S-methyltransferase/methylenetetrahydrofolate reductase [Saccharibacillus sp. CPCC 101409]
MGLLDELRRRVVVADGAMGTLLYLNGIDRCFEELNLTRPEQVRQIHQAYLTAGAEVIQTNTYAANDQKLKRYNLEYELEAINRAGARLARSAAEDTGAYVLGTIGGIRSTKPGEATIGEIKRSNERQIDALLDEGVDGLLLETFYDPEELRATLSVARKKTDLPIVAQVSTQDSGYLQDGSTLTEIFAVLEDLGADVVGLNCRLGPFHMTRYLKQVPLPKHAFLSAYPNAGLPEYNEGRLRYRSGADYFGRSALELRGEGVRLIGGCCGTTPEHVAAMAAAVKGAEPVTDKVVETLQSAEAALQSRIEVRDPVGSADDEEGPPPEVPFHKMTAAKGHSVIVELDPPRTLRTEGFFKGVQALKEAGIDALTMADNSLASPRIANESLASVIKEKYGVRPLVHVACRDRNMIGLQSHLMGLASSGINQMIAITGDPSKVGDVPGATSVYDYNSFDLIKLCKQFNEGRLPSGRSLGLRANFSVGAAFDPNVRHLDKGVQRLEKKIAAGADYFMTQPVYDERRIEELYHATKHLQQQIFIGVMPLVSAQNAAFLHNEVPGIRLTDEILARMQRHEHDKEAAMREGMAISRSLIDAILNYFSGVYIMTPFLRYEQSAELTRYVHEAAKRKERNIRLVQ